MCLDILYSIFILQYRKCIGFKNLFCFQKNFLIEIVIDKIEKLKKKNLCRFPLFAIFPQSYCRTTNQVLFSRLTIKVLKTNKIN